MLTSASVIDNRCKRTTHVIVDPCFGDSLESLLVSLKSRKKSQVWVERNSLSNMSVVLPVIIIQARFSRG